MNFPTDVAAPPTEAEWRELARRIERAFGVLSEDSLGGLAQLHEIENHGHELIDRVIEHGVREARRQGKSWADIAEATGVARQAAWRRWTDRGIR